MVCPGGLVLFLERTLHRITGRLLEEPFLEQQRLRNTEKPWTSQENLIFRRDLRFIAHEGYPSPCGRAMRTVDEQHVCRLWTVHLRSEVISWVTSHGGSVEEKNSPAADASVKREKKKLRELGHVSRMSESEGVIGRGDNPIPPKGLHSGCPIPSPGTGQAWSVCK